LVGHAQLHSIVRRMHVVSGIAGKIAASHARTHALERAYAGAAQLCQ
jgi:hypothetical protein